MPRLDVSPTNRLVCSLLVVKEETDTAGSNWARALLMIRPKTCHNLWQEYMLGGSVRKRAKCFTLAKCGQAKRVHSLRRPLHKKAVKLVQNVCR